jgi:hypothetical protein
VRASAAEALSNRVFRKQGTFRMNLQSGASLVAANAIDVRAVNVTYQRPLAEDHIFGQDYVIEPDDDGWTEATAELVFPRMNTANSNSLVVMFPAGTHLKADFVFLGNYINSTTRYTFGMYFPSMQITDWAAPVTGHNLVRPTATVALRKASANPVNFGDSKPIGLEIINMNSATLVA